MPRSFEATNGILYRLTTAPPGWRKRLMSPAEAEAAATVGPGGGADGVDSAADPARGGFGGFGEGWGPGSSAPPGAPKGASFYRGSGGGDDGDDEEEAWRDSEEQDRWP